MGVGLLLEEGDESATKEDLLVVGGGGLCY